MNPLREKYNCEEMVDQIKKLIAEVEKARSMATPGEWVVQQKTLSNFAHPYIFDRIYGTIFDPTASSTRLINRPNCDFVVLAANKILALTKALTIAVEALEKTSQHLDRLSCIECEASVYSLDDDEFGLICFTRDRADDSLTEIAGVLKFDK